MFVVQSIRVIPIFYVEVCVCCPKIRVLPIFYVFMFVLQSIRVIPIFYDEVYTNVCCPKHSCNTYLLC